MCVLYQDVQGLLLTKKSLRGFGLDQDVTKLNLYKMLCILLLTRTGEGQGLDKDFRRLLLNY